MPSGDKKVSLNSSLRVVAIQHLLTFADAAKCLFVSHDWCQTMLDQFLAAERSIRCRCCGVLDGIGNEIVHHEKYRRSSFFFPSMHNRVPAHLLLGHGILSTSELLHGCTERDFFTCLSRDRLDPSGDSKVVCGLRVNHGSWQDHSYQQCFFALLHSFRYAIQCEAGYFNNGSSNADAETGEGSDEKTDNASGDDEINVFKTHSRTFARYSKQPDYHELVKNIRTQLDASSASRLNSDVIEDRDMIKHIIQAAHRRDVVHILLNFCNGTWKHWSTVLSPYPIQCFIEGYVTYEDVQVLIQYKGRGYIARRRESLDFGQPDDWDTPKLFNNALIHQCELVRCLHRTSEAGISVQQLALLSHECIVPWLFDTKHCNASLVKQGKIPFAGICQMKASSERQITQILNIVTEFVTKNTVAGVSTSIISPTPELICQLLSASRPSLLETLFSSKCINAIRDKYLQPDDILHTDSFVTAKRVEYLLNEPKLWAACISGIQNGHFKFSDLLLVSSKKRLSLLLSPTGLVAIGEGLITVSTFDSIKNDRTAVALLGQRGLNILRRNRSAINLGSKSFLEIVRKELEGQLHVDHVPLTGVPSLETELIMNDTTRSPDPSSYELLASNRKSHGTLATNKRAAAVAENGSKTSKLCIVTTQSCGGQSSASSTVAVSHTTNSTTQGSISTREETSNWLPDLLPSPQSDPSARCSSDPHVELDACGNQVHDYDVIEQKSVSCDISMTREPSSEKLASLEQFMNISGIEDEDKAVNVLCACEWDVAAALELAMAL